MLQRVVGWCGKNVVNVLLGELPGHLSKDLILEVWVVVKISYMQEHATLCISFHSVGMTSVTSKDVERLQTTSQVIHSHVSSPSEPPPPVGVLGCVAGRKGPGKQTSLAFLQNQLLDLKDPCESTEANRGVVRGILPLELRGMRNCNRITLTTISVQWAACANFFVQIVRLSQFYLYHKFVSQGFTICIAFNALQSLNTDSSNLFTGRHLI